MEPIPRKSYGQSSPVSQSPKQHLKKDPLIVSAFLLAGILLIILEGGLGRALVQEAYPGQSERIEGNVPPTNQEAMIVDGRAR
jgi:hypothetical protein